MVRLNQGLPVRGRSQLIILLCGSPLDGIRSVAFLAKELACSSLCRLSFGSDIHSRMIFRRSSCSGFIVKSLVSMVISEVVSALRGARTERPHRLHAAEHRYELATSHSITSSAMVRSVGCIVRPPPSSVMNWRRWT